MSLVPARDHLGEFLLLLETANGRDKLCRLIQYTSKAMKWRAEVDKQPEDNIKVSLAPAAQLCTAANEGGHARSIAHLTCVVCACSLLLS